MASSFMDRYGDEECVRFRAGGFEAMVIPRLGGNCVAFDEVDRPHHYLRTPSPEQLDRFRASPARFGIPVLCPPNRIADGEFSAAGRRYRFPIREEPNHNSLHGPFLRLPWELVSHGVDGDSAQVTVERRVDERDAIYGGVPHRFTLRLQYRLSAHGLEQHVTLDNSGDDALPFMLGFHTVLSAPFADGSTAENCIVRVPIEKRWETNDRILPTGRLLDLTPGERTMRTPGVRPDGERWNHCFMGERTDSPRRVTIDDIRAKTRLIYEVDAVFKHWVVWNDDAKSGFFCAEPQTCTINAPNLDLPADTTGLIAVEPGETWSARSTLFPERL